MWLQRPKSRHYEVIVLRSRFCFCDFEIRSRNTELDLKVSVVYVWLKIEFLNQGVIKLSLLQANFLTKIRANH